MKTPDEFNPDAIDERDRLEQEAAMLDDLGDFIVPYPDGSETFEEALENERNNALINQDDDE